MNKIIIAGLILGIFAVGFVSAGLLEIFPIVHLFNNADGTQDIITGGHYWNGERGWFDLTMSINGHEYNCVVRESGGYCDNID